MEDIERLARAAGVRGAPRLEDVQRRRVQLWLLSLLVVLALPAAFLVLGVLPPEVATFLNPTAVRVGLVMLLVAIVGYVVEGERSLRGLTGLLVDERSRTAVLEARIGELDLLLRASRALNASLDLDAVLGIILTSASELLAASEGVIWMVSADARDELEVAATSGCSSARRGERRALGSELAGLTALPATAVVSPTTVSVPLLHRDELVGVLDLLAPPRVCRSSSGARSRCSPRPRRRPSPTRPCTGPPRRRSHR